MKNKINIKQSLVFLFIGLIIGATGGVSFIKTNWASYSIDLFFWWSIFSTLIGFIFIIISIWQYWKNQGQEEKNKAQVKVWMQDANGIRQALQRIVRDNLDKRYSTTDDMGNAIWGVEATSGALYQSLYEERCVTEEEYKKRQKELSDLLSKQQIAEIESKTNQSVASNQ